MYVEEDTCTDLMQTRLWLMHRFCINCKLSGGISAVTGIKDAVPIIHGPIGCAYNHRIPVPKPWIDASAMPCTDLDENDTVFGGIDKLRRTIIEVDRNYQPKLIIVLLTCVTGIIGDDVAGLITELKNEQRVNADVVWADTSGFRFRDPKERTETSMQEIIHNYENPDDYKPRSEEGCGLVEVLNALAAQLMEDPSNNGGLIENGVNLVGVDSYWTSERTQELIDILTEIGARINTTFFVNTPIEGIKQAPRAKLNVVYRPGEWTKVMKEKFGTDVVYDDVFAVASLPYQERMRTFYHNIGEKLGLKDEMDEAVDRRLQKLNNDLQPYREILNGKRVVVLRGGDMLWGFDLPFAMMLDLGLEIVAISLDYDYLTDRNLLPEIQDQHYKMALDIFGKLGIQADIIDETPMGKEKEVVEKYRPDLVFTIQERKWKIQSLGVPAYERHPFRFQSYIQGLLDMAKEISTELKRENLTKKKPIIFQELDYDPIRYPHAKKSSPSLCVADEMRYSIHKRGGGR